ncbi:MAG: hypothetical protein ACREBU_09675, partial [Nitrososphaera sp.]
PTGLRPAAQPRAPLDSADHVEGTMEQVVTAASILFGFLFAGFWWALDRELKFPPDQRHFKPAYALLIGTMLLLAVFGVLLPLTSMAEATPTLRVPVIGIAAGLVGVFGYMLTELGHYSVYRKPIYSGPFEWFFFIVTVLSMLGLVVWAFL